MNEDFFKGMFMTLLILSMLALASDKGFSNKQLKSKISKFSKRF